ncbi:hypothetical protein ACFL3Q_06600 [Planctomycetota bacterium]
MKQAIMICTLVVLILTFSNKAWASVTITHAEVADFRIAQPDGYCLLSSTDAYISHIPKMCAYIDPGTGSFIIQLFLGFLFGGLFAIKLFWSSIKSFFCKLLFTKRNIGKDED